MPFLFNPYKLLLVAAAILPALFLIIRIYKLDRLEKEPVSLVFSLVLNGFWATLLAGLGERLLGGALELLSLSSWWTDFLLYFLVVAGCEEGLKYFFLRRSTWNNEQFNCQYDGVVYAVAVSLGFGLFENIAYVVQYGFGTAVIRAVTAVPGHACFGVFMGALYGLAKRWDNYGFARKGRRFSFLAVLLPMLLHGCYDFIATRSSEDSLSLSFIVFIAVLFFGSFLLVKQLSENDRYIEQEAP